VFVLWNAQRLMPRFEPIQPWIVNNPSPQGLVAFIGDENAGCAPAQSKQGRKSAMQRHRPTLHLFGDRIAKEKKRLQALAAELKPGPERDALLQKISQLDTIARINEWASSPGLQRPR
jgi:hypothetical protein